MVCGISMERPCRYLLAGLTWVIGVPYRPIRERRRMLKVLSLIMAERFTFLSRTTTRTTRRHHPRRSGPRTLIPITRFRTAQSLFLMGTVSHGDRAGDCSRLLLLQHFR